MACVLAEKNKGTKVPEQTTTVQILSELECMYQKTYGHSFAQSVLQSKCTNMQMKPTALEKMKAKRQIQ